MAAEDSSRKSDIDIRLQAGQLIGGQYRVGPMLGEGGMAVVWSGTNERTGKLVALKVIRPDVMSTPDAAALLHSEGLAASRINHPNVVTVFDVIEHAGMSCIVMELLHGLPLGTYLYRSGPLRLRETTNILLPAMRGVAAAHAQGVIHRDLKPQNIFLCIDPDGRMVTTKVLDFGISFMMDWAKVHAADTTPGLVGTPAYIAPEIIDGAKRIDERVDVYGFGLLFYEALTGQVPYPGDARTEVLKKVVTESLVPMQELRPDLSPGIIGIIKTATDKRPEKRFVSLNQMAAEIEDVMMRLPMPHASLPTPDAEVPGSALSYTLDGPLSLAVPTRIGRETSGQYAQTLLLGASPPPPKPAVDEAAPIPAGAPEAHPPAIAPTSAQDTPAPTDPGRISDWATAGRRGARALVRIVRRHPVIAGVAGVLVLGLGVWLAAGASDEAKARPPTPAARTTPEVTVLAAPPAPAAAEASPPSSQSALGLGAAADAGRRTAKSAPSSAGTRSARGELSGRKKGREKGRARVQHSPPAPPRAGTLRLGDF